MLQHNICEEIDKVEFLKKMGLHIRSVRMSKGVSAAELGRRTFMERSHIARIEKGNTNPTSTTLLSICNALDMSFEEFFKGFRV